VLRAGWKGGDATVVESHQIHDSWSNVGPNRGAGEIGEFVVDVRPDDHSPPFRATLKAKWCAADGDVRRVNIHAEDQHVKRDERTEWRKFQAAKKADQASEDSQFDDIVRRPSGTSEEG
jgi:hypothetical protein